MRLKFNPVTGAMLGAGRVQRAEDYRPLDAGESVAPWRYNPWTGQPRHKLDVESDPFGLAIVPSDGGLLAVANSRTCPECRGTPGHLPGCSRGPTVPVAAAEAGNQHSALAVQVGGGHYKGLVIQPVEYIHKNRIGYMEGNAIKYLTRWRQKNGVEDLKKARHYIDLLIEMESEAK